MGITSPITRAELAKMLVLAFGLEGKGETEPSFTDVNQTRGMSGTHLSWWRKILCRHRTDVLTRGEPLPTPSWYKWCLRL